MGGSIITVTNEIKYPGVIIDDKITWIPHAKNKVSKGIGIIFNAKNYLNKYALINLYHSYIYTLIWYIV